MRREFVFLEAEFEARVTTRQPNKFVTLQPGDAALIQGQPRIYIIVYFYIYHDKFGSHGWK
jgi:hypothetical protein